MHTDWPHSAVTAQKSPALILCCDCDDVSRHTIGMNRTIDGDDARIGSRVGTVPEKQGISRLKFCQGEAESLPGRRSRPWICIRAKWRNVVSRCGRIERESQTDK